MSVYEVAKFCRSCLRDTDLRALAKADPAAALDRFDLSHAERTALLAGEVGALYNMGASAFLLSYLPRWQIFGLDVATYSRRMRGAAGHPTAKPGMTGSETFESPDKQDRPSDAHDAHDDNDNDNNDPAPYPIGES